MPSDTVGEGEATGEGLGEGLGDFLTFLCLFLFFLAGGGLLRASGEGGRWR